jgi:hypothetical protein
MSRFVWPYIFTLRACGLIEAERQQTVASVREEFFPQSDGVLPVSLRWATTADLGFPREPFSVFRRLISSVDQQSSRLVVEKPVTVSGEVTLTVTADGDLAYMVFVPVSISSGFGVTLEALDVNNLPITGQSVTVAGTSSVEFRCPGIFAIRASGAGTVGPIEAVGENAYANFPDWQNIETVGLPFKDGEPGSAYDTAPQGFEPPALDGVAAAQQRTEIAALLHLPPWGTGLGDFPIPAWPLPDPDQYIDWIRSSDSFVPMIQRCLSNSDDANPAKMQSAYVEEVTLPGIKQASLPGATPDPGQVTKGQLPITAVTMVAVSTDCFSAVALGYGTTDIPPRIQSSPLPSPVYPAVNNYGDWDYMVTAPFTFPFGMKEELAALSSGQPPVEAPLGLQATVKDIHAPVIRDSSAPAVIKVSWVPPTTPQGYGVLASRAPNESEVLNSPRPSDVGGYLPFVGITPISSDPTTPPEFQIPSFSDTEAALPLAPPDNNTRYLVAGVDVFGQWSSWSLASAALSPAPIAKPGIRSAQFNLDVAAATGHSVPATLQIDFAWDWRDRSPGQIRFTGSFVAAPSGGLGPAFLAGMQMANAGLITPPAILTFSYASNAEASTVAPSVKIPTINLGHSVAEPVVVLKTADFDADEPRVLYRVEITGFKLDFSSATELDYALYVTAAEFIRPGEFSEPTDSAVQFIGALIRTMDPFPPVVTFAPPAISWTALPDATGKARGILEWTPDPKAAGYFVWEATESALNHLLAPDEVDPTPATPLVKRGGALKTLVLANQDKSLQGFARLNKDPIPGNRTEIVVPAAASTLFAYRISAISATNVESARSDQIAIFGVPRRNVPGTPRLLLRKPRSPQIGMKLIALPVDSGAPSAGFRVYRVRSEALSHDGSTMGPARISDTDSGWRSYSETSLAGTTLNGKTIVDTSAIPSWYPYYYRIKAVGVQDLANGMFSGESGFSDAQTGYVLPSEPPLIQAFNFSARLNFGLVTLVTDLPAAAPSPVGPALVELVQFVTTPADPKPVAKILTSSAPDRIPLGTLALPFSQFLLATGMRRSAPGADGTWTLYVLFPFALGQQGTFMVRLTDPLARRSLNSF